MRYREVLRMRPGSLLHVVQPGPCQAVTLVRVQRAGRWGGVVVTGKEAEEKAYYSTALALLHLPAKCPLSS